MSLGYRRPLYLLPFDHRHSYVTGMFEFTPPLTAAEHDVVADSKQVIYEGFRHALGGDLPTDRAGILLDEEFGAAILRDARANGYVTALSTEKSGYKYHQWLDVPYVTFQITAVKQPISDTKLVQEPGQKLDVGAIERPK